MRRISVLDEVDAPTAIDGVRHGSNHFRVPAKADGGDGFFLAVGLGDDGIRVGGQADVCLGVK